MIDGISPAKNKFFHNLDNPIISKQLTNVAKVPKIKSSGPAVEAIFAKKHPNVNPIVYVGLKKTSKFKASLNLNCENE